MTYLEQCRKLAREARITRATNIPSAVASQTGVLADVVGWVADAWKDIQNRHDNWRWMRHGFTLVTVADDPTYEFGDATDDDAGDATIERFKRWWLDDIYDRPRCYLQSAGVAAQYRLNYMVWEDFKHIYGIGTQTSGIPANISIDHLNRIHLGPKPNAVFVVNSDFQLGVQVLEDDDDEPEIPADYEDLVWRRAIEMYGMSSVASEVFARSQLEAGRTMRALERSQLPMIRMAGPLA